jgi:hypothetical protein
MEKFNQSQDSIVIFVKKILLVSPLIKINS